MIRWLALATVLAASGLALVATAEDDAAPHRTELGPVSAVVSVSPEAPVIGDPVVLELEVTAEPGVEVLMPEFGEALDRFSIVDFAPSESLDDQGRSVQRQRYTLQASRSGPQSIPPLLVEFVDRRPGRPPAPDDADAYELLTDRVEFEVAGVLPKDAPLELRPALGALGPLETPGPPLWPWIVAGAALLAAVSPFALRAWQARAARLRRRSAYEVARADLDALLYGPRPDAAAMDAFYVQLSGILRTYLENRFAVRSPELTTEEFLAQLSDSPELLRAHRDLLQGFLRGADLVKFAHFVPGPEDVERSVNDVQRFLEATRPETGVGPARAPEALRA